MVNHQSLTRIRKDVDESLIRLRNKVDRSFKTLVTTGTLPVVTALMPNVNSLNDNPQP